MITVQTTNATRRQLLIDAHAHLHRCFDADQAVSSAIDNFRLRAAKLTLPAGWTGCLLCADLQTGEAESRVGQLASRHHPDHKLESLDQSHCWRFADCASDRRLILIFGNQIVTNDGIEVLAYGLDRRIPDGLSAANTVQQALAQKALVILPWGFGKWTFRRRKVVEELIRTCPPGPGGHGRLFVGDNGGRLRYSRLPRLLGRARQAGVWNLPGSDPLPFHGEETRLGQAGFLLNVTGNPERPLDNIKHSLCPLAEQPVVFGQGQSWARFWKFQTGMQFRKLRGEMVNQDGT